MPRWRASISVTISIDSSCVVNALVLATPISGPAWVIMTRSDSRTIELWALLQTVSDPT
jgi:hypothetical protein